MIAQLTGKLLECAPGQIVIDVCGVGYRLQIALPTFYALVENGPGAELSVQVHTHVREDAIQLYGFLSAEERDMFELLIAISGVGPRMALAVLSGIGAEELRAVVGAQDRRRLQSVPGIGQKTADRILLELRDRLSKRTSSKRRGALAVPSSGVASVERDAESALINLGYAPEAARLAVDEAVSDNGGAVGPIEVVIRTALARLIRGASSR